jgi:hypothetical protein
MVFGGIFIPHIKDTKFLTIYQSICYKVSTICDCPYIKPYTFEVGGMKKGKRQIENVSDGIVVKDDIETGHGIIIPLWYFGMNY